MHLTQVLPETDHCHIQSYVTIVLCHPYHLDAFTIINVNQKYVFHFYASFDENPVTSNTASHLDQTVCICPINKTPSLYMYELKPYMIVLPFN